MDKKSAITNGLILVLLLTLIVNTSKTIFTEEREDKSEYIDKPAKGYREYSNLTWIWNDIPKALEIARQEKKLVLMDFWAIWCPWCIKADKITFPHPKVEALLKERFVVVKIDVDRYPHLQTKYGAQALPTVVILDENGNVLGRIVGFRQPEDFIQEVLNIIGKLLLVKK